MFLWKARRNYFKIGNVIQGFFSEKPYNCCEMKTYCQEASADDETNAFIPFMKMIEMRRSQASRSVLVQVQSAQSYKELSTYCESIGKVKNIFHYSEGPEAMHFILVEFSSEDDVKRVLETSTHIQDNQNVPATSQFLWFRAAPKKLGKLKQNKQAKLSIENGTKVISESELRGTLKHCKTISDQINQLYNLTRLNDLGQRLRFLTAKQVEGAMSGIFPKVCAFPFGSSVNGFGKMDCDLDIVLRLGSEKEKDASRLVYHCKAASGSERSTNQRNMETVGDLLNLFLPGCSQVRRILQAKVPIIKYHQQLTNIECDLSMSNMSGVYMSDFLFIMGEIDPRVRPLVFAIRKWAKEVYLTNTTPGKWISNFSLTLLVLAFLQKPLRSSPVLPTLNHLTKLAGPEDQYITEEGINGTFLRNIQNLNLKNQNTDSLESLLLEFFEHYAQFDFSRKAICLNEAVSITKPEHSPLYIVNPLERGLNVSKNVSVEELDRFKIEVRNAAWLLESQKNKLDDKGLLTIFEMKQNMQEKLNFVFSQKNNRLMEVSALFEEDEEIKEVEYKNAQVKNAVQNIKKETKENIKSIENQHRRRKSGR
ncbi:poly(A) RNA polymerase, mitochondrial isoform X1 [Euwallacea similis]|uniref:poly(A) RNA polymerase, mitochondrial isoform X1 n=1 Tax=Euwallacea similis TaxID=1736056 RepID=UPI00344CD367